MKKGTAGREYLGSLAPVFARFNDDVLFGEVWSREKELSPRDRSMITIAALMGAGLLDESLKGHLETGLENGLTVSELVEMITHLAFYTGWPKAWSAFSLLSQVPEGQKKDEENGSAEEFQPLFGFGNPNSEEFARYFTGRCWVNPLKDWDKELNYFVDNVTFEPGCRNAWHTHPTGQLLFVTDGRGWYQEWGREPRELKPGGVVDIPANVKHWHGAAKDSWFAHVAMEVQPVPGEWLEAVSDEEYSQLP